MSYKNVCYVSHGLSIIYLIIAEVRISNTARTHLKSHHVRDSKNVPCPFYQTVNITNAIHFRNGSYLYEDILIPPNWTGVYDYVVTNLETRVPVAPHLRGCLCKVKPCINICCSVGFKFSVQSRKCLPINTTLTWPSTIKVHLENGTIQHSIIKQEFAVISFRPCLSMYALIPEERPNDEWHLYQNGSIFRLHDLTLLDIKHYCLVPVALNSNDSEYIFNPANCQYSDFITMQQIYAYGMLFSIPFMIITIMVYMLIPELRNQHGKSLICYLWGLSVGYSILCFNSLFLRSDINLVACKVMGYTAYYFFMSAFLWLNVISFDLWLNFQGTRGINRSKEKRLFLLYSIYSWGLALLLLMLTWFAQEIADIPNYLKPEIDLDYCWLNMTTWSALIYFFGPIIIITVANTIMFINTYTKINRVKQEMCKIIAREDSTRSLRNERDRFGLFLRLFLVMGITWSWEILSYFVGSEVSWSKIFYIGDICNAAQGFLIFMLFVMKKKMKKLIINRICNKECGHQNQKQHSLETTSCKGFSGKRLEQNNKQQTTEISQEK